MAQGRKSLEEKLRSDLGVAEEASPVARATTPSLPPSSPLDPYKTRQMLSFSNGHIISLPKKTILISGGTAGIGLALVRIFAKNGFNVATFSSTDEKVKRTQAEFKDQRNVLIEKIDIRNPVVLSIFVERVEREFGPVQFLINNAAVTGHFLPNEEVSEEDISEVTDVNVRGLQHLTGIVQQRIQATNTINSVTINLSSITAEGIAGIGSYSASKAAVNTFSASLAKEHPFSSHFVFAFDPGPVDTDMQAKLRAADPKKIRLATTAEKWHKDGKLINPSKTAEQIYFLVTRPGLFSAENGTVLSHATVQEQMENPSKRKRSPSFP